MVGINLFPAAVQSQSKQVQMHDNVNIMCFQPKSDILVKVALLLVQRYASICGRPVLIDVLACFLSCAFCFHSTLTPMCLLKVVGGMLYLSDLQLSLCHVVVGALFSNNPELLRCVFKDWQYSDQDCASSFQSSPLWSVT